MEMSKKFLLTGLLLGGALLLLLYFWKGRPLQKVTDKKEGFSREVAGIKKETVPRVEKELKEGISPDIKILPVDKRVLSEIREKWKSIIKERLENVINDGSKGRDIDDLLINTAIGAGSDFHAEFRKIAISNQKGLKFISSLALAGTEDSPSISELEWALKNGTWQTKLLAAKVLAINGDERGLPQVREICEHPDWGARIEAVRTLGYFKSGTPKNELLSYLNDTDEHIRTSAAAALAMLGEEQGVNYLKKNLTHYDPAIRIYSAETLARIKNSAPINIFINETASEDPYERIHGAVYLLVLGDGRGDDIVLNALKNPEENTGRYVLALLSENLRYIQ